MSEQDTGKPEGEVLETETTTAPEGESTTGEPESRTAEDQGVSATPKAGDDPEGERKNGVQKRIDKLVKEKYESRREIESLRKEVEELKSAQTKPVTPPKVEDFDDHDDYIAAKVEYELTSRESASKKESKERELRAAEEEEKRKTSEAFAQRVSDARQVYSDFDEVAFSDFPLTTAMYDVVSSHERGADLAYYLGSNPEEADRIASLPSHLASAELGALATTLKRPQSKKTTTAPDPLKPVGGKEGADKPLAELSYEEYKARRMRD